MPQLSQIDIEINHKNQSLSQRKASMSKGQYKALKLGNSEIPINQRLKKPSWIRAKAPSVQQVDKVEKIKKLLRDNKLNSVCEEASCPNLPECFSHGTATFMIMGDICTRKCPFCDVAHGRPKPLDESEPNNLADAIKQLFLKYVVITSVDRDDLKDGGAIHFANCINRIRTQCPNITIEILTPDFRNCEQQAIDILSQNPPNVFNHNLETVPQIYPHTRPGADYKKSLELLKIFKYQNPNILTKSGIMVGLGETKQQVFKVMEDMRHHNINMLTVGQYLQPSGFHLKVERYVTPQEFKEYETLGYELGFKNVASGPMVRSSYHADLQATSIN